MGTPTPPPPRSSFWLRTGGRGGGVVPHASGRRVAVSSLRLRASACFSLAVREWLLAPSFEHEGNPADPKEAFGRLIPAARVVVVVVGPPAATAGASADPKETADGDDTLCRRRSVDNPHLGGLKKILFLPSSCCCLFSRGQPSFEQERIPSEEQWRSQS
ncbi:hypothetical protein NL676_026618 [Syzygium grande]|nr:hypothetical protein NL676_026618 [Syzygium grande]